MNNNKPLHRSSIKEACRFGVGCLLGGLLGVLAGLLSRNETVIIFSYSIGFVSGGFLAAFATRRRTKQSGSPEVRK
jgi:hypothetical protein